MVLLKPGRRSRIPLREPQQIIQARMPDASAPSRVLVFCLRHFLRKPIPHFGQRDPQIMVVAHGAHPSFRAVHPFEFAGSEKEKLMGVACRPPYADPAQAGRDLPHTGDAPIGDFYAISCMDLRGHGSLPSLIQRRRSTFPTGASARHSIEAPRPQGGASRQGKNQT